MKKCSLLLLFTVILIPSLTWAQGTPSCGLNNDQTPLIPSQYVGKVSVSGSTVTWVSGSQFVTSWTGSIYLYPASSDGTAYRISSVASTTSLTLTTSPAAGNYDYTFNINWDTFVPPAVGSSYVDPLSRCTFTRLTNNSPAGSGWVEYYSTQESFNQDDSLIHLVNAATGGHEIVAGPTFGSGITPGTVVVPSLPGMNGYIAPWFWTSTPGVTNNNKFYYFSGTSINIGTINGLPSCASTNNCTVTSSTLVSFASSGGSTGAGYTSISGMDEYDSTANYLMFVGRNSSGTIDVDVWNLNTSTNVVWYTTTCTATNPLGNQPGCIHKLQMFPDGTPSVNFEGGNGNEAGSVTWMHGIPGRATVTQTVLENGLAHYDVGVMPNGVQSYIINRVSPGTDACPSGQWSDAGGGGGQTMLFATEPTNSGGTGICMPNLNWSSTEISGRYTVARPWFVTSLFDQRTTSPENYNTNGNYVAPICTQTNTTTSGSCWYPYENEILLVNTNVNMNTAGTGPLSGVYRLGWTRSRSNNGVTNFWTIPKASLSRDGNYIVFDSAVAWPAGNCNATTLADVGCADVMLISGPNGGPLLGGTGLLPPPSLAGVLQ
jgi:hypothetical protein